MVPYRSILIVGGGTAGWMAAAYLQRILGNNPDAPVAIRLVESADIGTIGVGEATVPTLRNMMRVLDIPETMLFSDADATLKNGIRFVGWRHGGDAVSDSYDHPFDPPQVMEGYSTIAHWLNLKQRGMTDRPYAEAGTVQTALFDKDLSPKLMNSPPFEAPVSYAYHLDAVKLAGVLMRVATQRGVQHTIGKVEKVDVNEQGIEAVHLEDGQRLAADLFVDCTGFASILNGKALGVPWVSYSDTLLCDRAVACPVAHSDPNAPLRSYTRATAQDSGWTWEIDLQSRRGTGYVYSSAHCSDAEALATLRRLHGDAVPLAEPRFLKMRIGHQARMWEKNCLSLGLASGFIEPLESTGIYLVEHALQLFIDFLPARAGATHGQAKYNELMSDLYDELHDFILLHYVISMRSDTPFWRAYTQQVKIPARLQALLDLWDEKLPHATDLQRKMSLFGAANYFFILAGMNRLPAHGIGQSYYIDPKLSRGVLDYVATVRGMAAQQSPTMRDYARKVSAAVRNAPRS